MKIYTVGQVLFLIANNKVVPIQVIEEIIRTTLKGTEKSYIVLFPDKDKTTVDIKDIKGKLFTNQSQVKSHMLENATKAINEMINNASKLSVAAFDANQDEAIEEEQPAINVVTHDNLIPLPVEGDQKMQPVSNNNIITVDLGEGKIGKISQNSLEHLGEA